MMQGGFLREIAARCLSAARQTLEREAKETFVAIAEDLLRKANEVDGLIPPAPLRRQPPDLVHSCKW